MIQRQGVKLCFTRPVGFTPRNPSGCLPACSEVGATIACSGNKKVKVPSCSFFPSPAPPHRNTTGAESHRGDQGQTSRGRRGETRRQARLRRRRHGERTASGPRSRGSCQRHSRGRCPAAGCCCDGPCCCCCCYCGRKPSRDRGRGSGGWRGCRGGCRCGGVAGRGCPTVQGCQERGKEEGPQKEVERGRILFGLYEGSWVWTSSSESHARSNEVASGLV